MPTKDYCARLLAKPLPSSKDYNRLGDTWLLVYARAETIEEAAAAIRAYLQNDQWELIRVENSGAIDVRQTRDPDVLEAGLSEHGVFAVLDSSPPDPRNRFSQN